MLEAMIRAGVNVVRLNFSHGKAQDHIDRARSWCVRLLPGLAVKWPSWRTCKGPKIRVGKFADGKVMLVPGAQFVLDASRAELGDLIGCRLDYKELPRDVKAGDVLCCSTMV
jgi:pyruvate kinase